MKGMAILNPNFLTQCFDPKEYPIPSLSVKHCPLTCLGQDLSVTGCQIALTVS